MEINSVLHRKLQSKTDALRILRRELEKFRTERDQFKLMAETLQLRYSSLKRCGDGGGGGEALPMPMGSGGGGKSNVASLLHETRERNTRLTTEVEALKQKLDELHGDIELLRSKQAQTQTTAPGKTDGKRSSVKTKDSKEQLEWKEERALFICHLENLKKKNAQLAFDFKTIIDEKEELITERDAYKCKAHRLNHELIVALKANETHPKFLDVDSILLENKYLHERLKNFENELEITKESMNKYKTMLESKRKRGALKLGSSTATASDESILSHKQVKAMLESGIDLPTKTETIQDLKSLCLALLDNLNDKNVALSHQKKTNKMLATKIAELEQRVQTLIGLDDNDAAESLSNGYAPSQFLLHGYCPSLVDASANETANTMNAVKTNESLKSQCNITDDSGTMSSEADESHKNSRGGISDDGMSSLSTESGRSIVSSEYIGASVDGAPCHFTDFPIHNSNALFNAYNKMSFSTTPPNSKAVMQQMNTFIPSSIARQRMEDLKGLPPELAQLVQNALHELDMRDFDELIVSDATTNLHDDDDVEEVDDFKHAQHSAEIHSIPLANDDGIVEDEIKTL